MLRLRPYKKEDAEVIISWSQDERSFYQWSAGVMGNYPITKNEFSFIDNLLAFTAFDENGMVGFFTLRNPGESVDELRFGFVIINPQCRGSGKGKEMLELGLKYAFEIYRAKKASLGVFENNEPAYYCYKAVGFKDVELERIESYKVLNEEWKCKELVIEK
ncbi:MAG: GNAT family N-acetyltransferase [Pseudobutyrivibrio sp.]|nr:GNAT family N-acetyltransferase [Pseudobutyrivibrio sp.]